MSEAPKTELFASVEPHARYAVDLIYRLVMRVESSPQVDHNLRDIVGPELWDEVCHAIGWDIDWDKVRGQG